MLNSKEVLEQTGISRATLNNYISWGIVPKPDVLPPEPQDGGAPRIGYFPDEVVARITEIQRLKRDGWSMSRIAEHFGAAAPPSAGPEFDAPVRMADAPSRPVRGVLPQLSIDEITQAAYFVNHSFEVVWFNEAAESDLLRQTGRPLAGAAPQNAFKYLFADQAVDEPARDRLLRFHLGMARQRRIAIHTLCTGLSPEEARHLQDLLHEPRERPEAGLISHLWFSGRVGAIAQSLCLYAVQFREGTLFVQVAGGQPSGELSTLLAERERRGIEGRKRLPVLSQVAVLATELEHSNRIWSELPPEEYFELINQIWLTVDPILRRNQGTHGKHAGDGMVGYFFPHPDTSYAWNALVAAHEVREAMRRVSKEWQLRKGWSTELYMNTGIDEGQQWVSTAAAPGELDFTMLGDTLNHASRLSDFGSGGAIWATKTLLGKLTSQEKQRLRYGVRRKSGEGRQWFVPAVFSTVERLCDPAAVAGQRLSAIARLPIAEVLEIAPTDKRGERPIEQDHN